MNKNIFNLQYKHTDLGEDLQTVRDKLGQLEFDNGINILALQPGAGKTHKIKTFLQENNNWVITAPNYDLINSEYEEITKIEGVNYWKGFNYLCLKYLEGDKFVTKLRDRIELYPSIICNKVCTSKGKGKCPYKKQFNSSGNVITVSSFYNTPLFYNDGKFKFDIAVIDEELTGYDEIALNMDEIAKAMDVIYEYVHENTDLPEGEGSDFRPDFWELINNKAAFSSEGSYENALIIFKSIKADQFRAMGCAISENKWNDIKTIGTLDINKLKKWFYYYAIYGEEKEYGEPNAYKLFDLARQNVKVVFSDATFSKKVFDELLKRYEYENNIIPRQVLLKSYISDKKDYVIPKFSDKINVNVYNSNIKDENRLIHHMWMSSKFNRGYIPREVVDFIERVRRVKYKEEVGIISYKKPKDRIWDFAKRGDFLNFGNLRGVNTFKDKDVLFIIGTPIYPSDAKTKEYNALFVRNEESIKIDWDSESDELNLNEYLKYLVESELYQAIHRARPFENSKTEIFLFGRMVKKIEGEFKVFKSDKNGTPIYFEGKYDVILPHALVTSLYNYCSEYPKMRSVEIASKFKLYKNSSKKSFNTKLITAIRKGEISLNDAYRVNNAFLEGLNTVSSIKRKYKSIKMADEFIGDLIYYAQKGKFVGLADD